MQIGSQDTTIEFKVLTIRTHKMSKCRRSYWDIRQNHIAKGGPARRLRNKESRYIIFEHSKPPDGSIGFTTLCQGTVLQQWLLTHDNVFSSRHEREIRRSCSSATIRPMLAYTRSRSVLLRCFRRSRRKRTVGYIIYYIGGKRGRPREANHFARSSKNPRLVLWAANRLFYS